MKYLFFIILLTLLLGCSIFRKGYTFSEPKIPIKEDYDSINLANYQLIRIDTISYKHNNIFYFEKNDSIFKIVSKKEIIQSCQLLVMDKVYALKLKGLRPKIIVNYLDIGAIMSYGREVVYFEKDSGIIWNLYRTPYIRDVCYIKD